MAEELGMQTVHEYDGTEYFYYRSDWDNPEREKIVKMFRKYGYGDHEVHGPVYDEDGNKVVLYMGDLLLAPDESSYFEGGRNFDTWKIDFTPMFHKINAPRIGTSDFFGR
jgi:hypothetical protein